MDKVDIQILDCLKKNSRENASVIGNKINMSVSAVIERIKKLEKNGIIKQYSIILDSKMMGMDVLAFIWVGMEHPKYNNDFMNFVKHHNRIVECHYITGDFDYLLKVNTDTTQSLEIILNEIKSVGGVSLTRTLVVLSTVKEDFSVTLNEGDIEQ
ncbi:MAG: Lrp/AsnC family transcriptional regulator [Clostridiales bacterium]|jgi:Lrp/AsnC family leucine-responsive transcriptional regulator|nr:Lrp/AsnC family transcriptional regulator [Clostridiales bacterium]